MSRNSIVMLTLLVVCLVLGVVNGQWFYGLYRDSIPEALKSTVSLRGTHYVFLFHGAGSGFAVFLVGLAAYFGGRFVQRSKPAVRTPPPV